MISNIILILLRCLILTILFETSLALILKVRDKLDILNVILVQIITNPIVVSVSLYINIFYGYIAIRISLGILEVLAVLIEGFIYYKTLKYKRINPFLLSLILNAFSFTIGLFIN